MGEIANLNKALEDKILSKETAAYLDLCLEYGRSICVAGPVGLREPVTALLKELASQYGPVYKVRTAGTLEGIAVDETPFKTSDFILADLDLKNREFVKAFLGLTYSGRVRGIAECSYSSMLSFVGGLEKITGINRYEITRWNVVISVFALPNGSVKIREITEFLGLDPVNEDLITNDVYAIRGGQEMAVFTGHSETFETVADLTGMGYDGVVSEVEKRAEKF